jgi:hypothetical protein
MASHWLHQLPMAAVDKYIIVCPNLAQAIELSVKSPKPGAGTPCFSNTWADMQYTVWKFYKVIQQGRKLIFGPKQGLLFREVFVNAIFICTLIQHDKGLNSSYMYTHQYYAPHVAHLYSTGCCSSYQLFHTSRIPLQISKPISHMY